MNKHWQEMFTGAAVRGYAPEIMLAGLVNKNPKFTISSAH
jgi:hypothetical protein